MGISDWIIISLTAVIAISTFGQFVIAGHATRLALFNLRYDRYRDFEKLVNALEIAQSKLQFDQRGTVDKILEIAVLADEIERIWEDANPNIKMLKDVINRSANPPTKNQFDDIVDKAINVHLFMRSDLSLEEPLLIRWLRKKPAPVLTVQSK